MSTQRIRGVFVRDTELRPLMPVSRACATQWVRDKQAKWSGDLSFPLIQLQTVLLTEPLRPMVMGIVGYTSHLAILVLSQGHKSVQLHAHIVLPMMHIGAQPYADVVQTAFQLPDNEPLRDYLLRLPVPSPEHTARLLHLIYIRLRGIAPIAHMWFLPHTPQPDPENTEPVEFPAELRSLQHVFGQYAQQGALPPPSHVVAVPVLTDRSDAEEMEPYFPVLLDDAYIGLVQMWHQGRQRRVMHPGIVRSVDDMYGGTDLAVPYHSSLVSGVRWQPFHVPGTAISEIQSASPIAFLPLAPDEVYLLPAHLSFRDPLEHSF